MGPLTIPEGRELAHANPRGYGERGSYKMGFLFAPGSDITVSIGVPASSFTVLTSPQINAAAGHNGTTTVHYTTCQQWGFFPQSIRFTDGRARGCVPLDITVNGKARVRRIILDLFERSCAK